MSMMTKAHYSVQDKDEWGKWLREIPFIPIPNDWEVRLAPPVSGAVVRMHVRKKGYGDWVSVYLDCYDRLGYYHERDAYVPYWEVMPYDGDVGRCGINEVDKLVEMIEQGLEGIG